MSLSRLAACLAAALPAACATPPPRPEVTQRAPPFATRPYEPFSRAAAIAIALREWRLFGQAIDDDPPGTHPPPDPDAKPERVEGLWQRVGEYWWAGQNPGPESGWTGKHDQSGAVFPASEDGSFAWSAAFISYVMRIAGAGPRFPYAPAHATYINAARAGTPGIALTAEPPERYRPVPGDLICFGRLDARSLRFDDLPTGSFPGHCDIVVAAEASQLAVIGGNVDDAVTLKHVPLTPEGLLAGPDGTPADPRYPWFVVLRVLYDR